MADRNTAEFLRLMEKQNVAVAAAEAAKKVQRVPPDPFKLQRDQERREKYGELRAREKSSKRPNRTRRVFPHVDLS